MVNTHISISRVFTALTRLDSGVETNGNIDLGELVRGVPAIDFASSAVTRLRGLSGPVIGRPAQLDWSVILMMYLGLKHLCVV